MPPTSPSFFAHSYYSQYIDPNFKYTNFTLDEQAKILKAGRSNNELVFTSHITLPRFHIADFVAGHNEDFSNVSQHPTHQGLHGGSLRAHGQEHEPPPRQVKLPFNPISQNSISQIRSVQPNPPSNQSITNQPTNQPAQSSSSNPKATNSGCVHLPPACSHFACMNQ